VDQRVSSSFETPPIESLPKISAAHVEAMENSQDDSAWITLNMHYVVLRTIGRRSGKEHKVALPFWRDPDGHRIVMGSYAASPTHPAWYLNLTDREANPDVHVRVQTGEYRCVPEIIEGDERERLWALLLQDRPFYANYQRQIERKIPMVRLRQE
jgi:F420H(2)-dependent quinone reductase